MSATIASTRMYAPKMGKQAPLTCANDKSHHHTATKRKTNLCIEFVSFAVHMSSHKMQPLEVENLAPCQCTQKSRDEETPISAGETWASRFLVNQAWQEVKQLTSINKPCFAQVYKIEVDGSSKVWLYTVKLSFVPSKRSIGTWSCFRGNRNRLDRMHQTMLLNWHRFHNFQYIRQALQVFAILASRASSSSASCHGNAVMHFPTRPVQST